MHTLLITLALFASSQFANSPTPDDCTFFTDAGECDPYFTLDDDPPGTIYQCQLLTMQHGNVVVLITIVSCPDLAPDVIAEDEAGWNCHTMGNMVCGYNHHPYPIVRR
jgi:hypothetical protein